MAAVKVQDGGVNTSLAGSQATSRTLTWGTTPTVGNKVIILVTGYSGTSGNTLSATDNASPANTYNIRQLASAGDSWTAIVEADITHAPTTTTLTFNNANFITFEMMEWSGLATAPAYDTGALSTISYAAGGTTFSVGPTGTLAQASELAIAVGQISNGDAAQAMAVPSGYTALGYCQDDSALNSFAAGYLVTAATTALTAGFTCKSGMGGGSSPMSLATFKIATGGGTNATTGTSPFGGLGITGGAISKSIATVGTSPFGGLGVTGATLTSGPNAATVTSPFGGLGVTGATLVQTKPLAGTSPFGGLGIAAGTLTNVNTATGTSPYGGLGITGGTLTFSNPLAAVSNFGGLGITGATLTSGPNATTGTGAYGGLGITGATLSSGIPFNGSTNWASFISAGALTSISAATGVGAFGGLGVTGGTLVQTKPVTGTSPFGGLGITGGTLTLQTNTMVGVGTPFGGLGVAGATLNALPINAVGTSPWAGLGSTGQIITPINPLVARSTFGPLGVLAPLARDYSGAGALFQAIQASKLPFYVNRPPSAFQSAPILYGSGSWQVPAGATSVFVSATAAGGTPLGIAGQQTFHKPLSVKVGDLITATFLANGDVSLSVAGSVILYLFAGAAGGKTAWQTLGQDSGIPGFGSGVDAGTPWPPIVVFYWATS